MRLFPAFLMDKGLITAEQVGELESAIKNSLPVREREILL